MQNSTDHSHRTAAASYIVDMDETSKAQMNMPVPLQVYLQSSEYEPDAEYVDGEIEERSMGEFDNNAWRQAIQLVLRACEGMEHTCRTGAAYSCGADAVSGARCYGN